MTTPRVPPLLAAALLASTPLAATDAPDAPPAAMLFLTDPPELADRLRVISAWPNPQNPERGVVIYTAQRAEDVVEINAVFHGQTDYVVARGREVLFAGDYEKDGEGWRFPEPAP